MSILITGLNMPAGDNWRTVRIHSDGSVFRPIGCGDYALIKEAKAIAVPDHGDLIDRNMLIGGFADWYIQESPMYLGDDKVVAETIGEAMKAIEAAPVIIPAERSKE